MVRQHDPAGADADRLGATRDMPDHHRCRRARNARHVVMLGEPEALVAPALDVPGEIERIGKRLRRIAALTDGSEVEHGEGDHGRYRMGGSAQMMRVWNITCSVSAQDG